jgi:drug/metabolite transporter (DMT)-like permease
LLWSFSSVVVALFGILFLKERPTLFQWSGIIIAVIGAVVYFSPISIPKGYKMGFLASGIGILANAGASNLGRNINRSGKLHPLIVTVISMGFGSIFLLTTGIFIQGLPSIGLKGWVIIIYLAFVNTAVAFTLWNYTLQTLSATESSVINGTMLFWVPILAFLFLDERITIKEIMGLIVAGVGTLIVQLRDVSTLSRLFVRRDNR